MIDPIKFTNFNLDKRGLQEYALFAVAVAGKNAMTTARVLEDFLKFSCRATGRRDYFKSILELNQKEPLAAVMKRFGFGCYQLKARGFLGLAESGLDLRTCAIEDLEAIPGIGLKTSRFFVMHTRRNAQISCLDVHILSWMRRRGYANIPEQTPSSKKRYLDIERKFLTLANEMQVSPSKLDLYIWNQERSRKLER